MAWTDIENGELGSSVRTKLNALGGRVDGFETVLTSNSTVSQDPVSLDTPITINFGTPSVENTTYVTMSAGGILEFQPAAVGRRFWSRIRYQLYRTTLTGEAHIGLWAEISTDSGSNWSGIGDSAIEIMDNQNTSQSLYIPIMFEPATAGDQFRFRLVRASTDFGEGAGVNNGGLASLDISAQVPDAPVAPSAAIVINMVNEDTTATSTGF